MRLWALPRWRWLLVPILTGTVFVICGAGILRLVDADSIHWVKTLRESPGLNGAILAFGIIAVVSYALGAFAIASQYRHGELPNPKKGGKK